MRILLVEPSRFGQALMSRMLTACGHEVVSATDGIEAFNRLRSDEAIEIVMTSFEIPGMSGLELCWNARLLTHNRRPLYVMAMSSSYDEKRLVEALDSGADDFVRKPPVQTELSARLRAAERLVSAQRDLIRLATIDQLTGLRNRRAFFEESETALADEAASVPFGVVLFDIDHFKRINDTFGHDAGDAVLGEMGRRLRLLAPHGARLGGEEFAFLMCGDDIPAAAHRAEEMRQLIEATPFESPAGPIPVTSSFGVAAVGSDRRLPQALKRADIALYAAKSSGRNRVMTSLSNPREHGSTESGNTFAAA